MNTVATVISVSGLAWAQNAAGELRLLSAGDRIQADESLLTTPATRMLVDFGNGNIVRFVGSEVDLETGAPSEIPMIVLPNAPAENDQEQPYRTPRMEEEEGYYFIQLVKIAEMIESDGLTPLNVAAIQEVLRPLEMGWGRVEPEEDIKRYGKGGEESRSVAEVDTVPPGARVELKGSGEDGIYNSTEIGPDNSVTAEITLKPGTEVGDTLVVTDKNGNELLNRPVTQEDLDNGISVEVPVQPGDTEVTVNASVTDPAGNSGNDTDTKPIDTELPSVSVELKGAGDDGIYDSDEIGPDNTVTAEVTLEAGTEVGDTLVVTDGDGNELLNRPVTQDDLDNGVSVEVPIQPGHGCRR